MKKIFALENSQAKITETSDGKAVYENDIKSYRLEKQNKNFKVYQVERKTSKKVLVANVRSTRTRKNFKDVIRDIKNNKIKIKTGYKDPIGGRGSEFIQTNHKIKVGKGSNIGTPQLMGVFLCSLGDREGTYVGYSTKTRKIKLTDSDYNRFIEEARIMAIRKFLVENDLIEAEENVDYTDVKNFDLYDNVQTELLEWRYLYVKRRFN